MDKRDKLLELFCWLAMLAIMALAGVYLENHYMPIDPLTLER